MLAYRRTWYIKLGCMHDALEMIQRAVDMFKERNGTGRAYLPNIGPADVIVWEENWADVQEHDQFWARYGDSPEAQEWFQQWFKLIERGGTQEIWDLKT
ncbi:MAG: hypothetical protein JW934_10310 [Anaerolineae bacterium]|nr:hypothetical protein [Anaerolineae bacterium]